MQTLTPEPRRTWNSAGYLLVDGALPPDRVAFFSDKIDEIRIYGDSAAEVEMTVGMAGTNDGVLGFSADAYAFELELERDDDEWLLISARWGELGQELK